MSTQATSNPQRDHMGDVVKALTDEALADRLRKATDRARGFSVAEREAFMREAASRLEAAHAEQDSLDALGVLRAGLSPARNPGAPFPLHPSYDPEASPAVRGSVRLRRFNERRTLADDLDLLAEERAHLGDAREAGVLRDRARAVRAGGADPGWS